MTLIAVSLNYRVGEEGALWFVSLAMTLDTIMICSWMWAP